MRRGKKYKSGQDKLGDRKLTNEYKLPKKPRHITFKLTAKEAKIDQLRKEGKLKTTSEFDTIKQRNHGKSLHSNPFGQATKKIVKVKRYKRWGNK